MSTTDEEKDRIIADCAEVLYIDILSRAYMSLDDLLEKLRELLEAK